MGYVSFIPKNSQSYLLPAYLSQHLRLLLHHGVIATAKSHGELAQALALLWKEMQWLLPKPLEGGKKKSHAIKSSHF